MHRTNRNKLSGNSYLFAGFGFLDFGFLRRSKTMKNLVAALFLTLYWKVCDTRYFLPMASSIRKRGIILKICIIFKTSAFGILFYDCSLLDSSLPMWGWHRHFLKNMNVNLRYFFICVLLWPELWFLTI